MVIDPEYLPSNVLQKNSKTDDLSALLPGYNYHGLVGADVVRVSLLFQGLVGENNELNTRHFDSIRFWFGQIQTLVHDMYAQHSRWKYRLLNSTPRAESAQRSTWIKDELLQSRIDPTLYLEIQRTVRSVTASLGQTFEFHVAISDLFGLAKLLTDTAIRETRCYGIGVLLKLIAPIAPAFAEEYWEELHWLGGWGDVTTIIQDNIARRQLADAHKGSIFRQDYPIPADILPLSDNHVQRCVVLEDGVLRFVAVIPIPCEDFTENMDATKLRLWVPEHVQKTKEWKEFARKVLVKLRRRVVVAKGARTVNLIPWGACDEIRETSASSGVLDIWSYLRPTWTG